MKTIDYQGTTYKCPFSERFRRHTKDERLTLQSSVEQYGIKNAIIVYTDAEHGDDCILDGEGRLTAITTKPNVKAVFKHAGKMTTDAAYEQAKIYNDHRRQDDAESVAKRRSERIERVAEARAEGKSLRAIAEEEGVSAEQVRKDVAAAGVKGLTPEPEKVTGKDGKKQSAKKKKKSAAATPEPVKQSDDEPDEKATEVQVEAIDAVAVIESVCRQIDQLNKQLDGIKKEPLAYPVHFHSVQSSLKNAREILWASRAVHADPYCKGTGTKNGDKCNTCKGTGKVIKSINTQAVRAVGPVEDAA